MKLQLKGSIDRDDTYDDRTLIVTRTKLSFNDRDCAVLSFQDITDIKRLKSEEGKNKLMSALYSSVHHEMIGPLKINENSALTLIRSLKDQKLREQA